MRVLAIGAHPDDLEIHVFGTLSAYENDGHDLCLVIATDGAAGREPDGGDLASIRKDEASAAAAQLKTEPHFFDFPDGQLSQAHHLVPKLVGTIDQFQPDIIFTHAPNDYHNDHCAVSNATRSAASFRAPVVYYETLAGIDFSPTHYVNVSEQMDRKCDAIRCHKSQSPERFIDLAKTQNRFRALQCNALPDKYAEAFRYEPRFPFGDIRELLPAPPPVRALQTSRETNIPQN